MESTLSAVKWLSLVIVTPILLMGFHYRQSLTIVWRMAFMQLMALMILASGVRDGRIMLSNIAHPPKWDFLLFWLYGRVAAQGLNFYQPEHAWRLAQQHQLPVDLLGVWVLYPPPTMFLFMPLGWFGIQTAHSLWYILLAGVLALDIYLLWKIFLSESGWAGLLLTAVLVFTLKATSMTIYFGQTHFMVLLMLLLFWRERERLRSGIWLAMGICVKPVLGILLMVLVLQRNWRVVVSALLTLVVISALAMIVFGTETFWGYFTVKPVANLPASVYTDPMNHSLLATLLRLTDPDPNGASPLTQPIFVVLSLVLAVITGWLVFRLGPDHADWALSLTLALGFLVYPATLEHYSFLLIVPMLLLWARRQELIGGVWGVVGFITLEYALIRSHEVFIAIALIWFVFAGVGAWMIWRRAGPSIPALLASFSSNGPEPG